MNKKEAEMKTTVGNPLHASVKEAAAFLGVAEQTLNNWRYLGKGPKFLKMGNKVRYYYSELKKYMSNAAVDPEQMCG